MKSLDRRFALAVAALTLASVAVGCSQETVDEPDQEETTSSDESSLRQIPTPRQIPDRSSRTGSNPGGGGGRNGGPGGMNAPVCLDRSGKAVRCP